MYLSLYFAVLKFCKMEVVESPPGARFNITDKINKYNIPVIESRISATFLWLKTSYCL